MFSEVHLQSRGTVAIGCCASTLKNFDVRATLTEHQFGCFSSERPQDDAVIGMDVQQKDVAKVTMECSEGARRHRVHGVHTVFSKPGREVFADAELIEMLLRKRKAKKSAGTCTPLLNPKCPSGTPGPDGKDGIDGEDGTPGVDGVIGEDAVSALDQYNSNTYIQCPVGETGPKGTTGPQGDTGINGLPGDDGVLTELPGPRGPPGETGEDGEPGIHGVPGAPGRSTTKWICPKGERGQPGNVGARGPPGPMGELGETGTHGVSGMQGGPGVQGPVGETGNEGLPGKSGRPGFEESYCKCPEGVRGHFTLPQGDVSAPTQDKYPQDLNFDK